MSFHAAASLFNTVSSLLLGLFVYLQGRKKSANILLALYTVAVASWSFGQFMGAIVPSYGQGLFWARFHLAGAIFIPVFFVHFVSAFLGRKKDQVILPSYILGVVIFLVSFTSLFVPSVSTKVGFRYFPDPGPAFVIYSIMFAVLVSRGLYELVRAYISSKGLAKNQILQVIIASVIGFSGGSMMFLPVFNVPIFPFGYYLVPLYIVIAIYAFMRHRLLDISIVIRKGLVYSIITLTVTVFYVLVILLLQEGFKVVTGVSSFLAAFSTVLLLAVFLNPFRDRIQRYVDMIFFKSRHDYQKALKSLSAMIRDTFDLDELLELVARNLKDIVKADDVAVHLYDVRSKRYVLAKGREAGTEGGPVFNLSVKGKPVGMLRLGPKLSQDEYSQEELDLIASVSNQLAVSIENAMLASDMLEAQRQLMLSDKLATVGTLAATLAHEIKNPLASIKGFSQIIGKAIKEKDEEAISDFSAVVPKQLDRINEMIEKLLRLSRPARPEKRPVSVNSVLDEIVKLLERQCIKSGVRVEKDYEGELVIDGDANQLTQAFMNIIINSIQAMPGGGELKLKIQNSRFKAVEITDKGKGIEREKLEHIFDPFFTTKESGTGLGLAVTKKIIDDHGGKIEIESMPGKGTTFRIIFNV